MPRRRKYGFSWSWKRATGLSGAKGRLSRSLGVPLTRSGRQRKVGRIAGCMLPVLTFLATMAAAVVLLSASLRGGDVATDYLEDHLEDHP